MAIELFIREEFSASNGWKVKIYDDKSVFVGSPFGRTLALSSQTVSALQQYFEHANDVFYRRVRERDPKYSNYVVYHPLDGVTVRVLSEVSGISRDFTKEDAQAGGDNVMANVARAYFERLEFEKPWLSAQPGEVWIATLQNGTETAVLVPEAGWELDVEAARLVYSPEREE